MKKLPSIPKVNIGKLGKIGKKLPDFPSIPKFKKLGKLPSLPDMPKLKTKLPSIPKAKMPSVPKLKLSVPKFKKLPDLPKLTIPKLSKLSMPKVGGKAKLPDHLPTPPQDVPRLKRSRATLNLNADKVVDKKKFSKLEAGFALIDLVDITATVTQIVMEQK